MPLYQRIFVVGDIAEIHREYLELLRVLRRLESASGANRPGVAAQIGVVQRSYRELNRDLRELALKTSVKATTEIRDRIVLRRPDTGSPPHLRDLIKCRPLHIAPPLESGAVGIADEAWLNRAINPHTPGYGPYWRAQEYGTGAGTEPGLPAVPSQVGRVLRGYFYGTGGGGAGTVPVELFRGRPGPHPVFVPAATRAGARGGRGGLGRISVEIRAKHFIRDGANAARAEWEASLNRARRDALVRLHSVL